MKTKKDLVIPFSWEERRPILLDRFFYVPKQYDHKEDRMSLEGPLFMEICSGNGQWVGEKAKKHPEITWLAVEMDFQRARKIWLKSFRENIPNLLVVCAEASAFVRYYAPVVEEAYVNFPDPWPKRCHGKHRLIWAPFVQLLQKVVKKKATLVTDDEPYCQQMVREFAKAGGWQRDEWLPEEYGASFFGDLWRERGREIFYLRYIPK